MPASDVTINAVFEKKAADAEKEISIGDISVTKDSFNGLWQFRFQDPDYLNSVKQISVNGTAWEAYSFTRPWAENIASKTDPWNLHRTVTVRLPH